jgi:hypothetical protein
MPCCDYLQENCEDGYTTTVGRAHSDGSVRLTREIPYGSLAESRNSLLERLGLERLPVHGAASGHVVVLQADFVANQRTLVRLIREATAFR